MVFLSKKKKGNEIEEEEEKAGRSENIKGRQQSPLELSKSWKVKETKHEISALSPPHDRKPKSRKKLKEEEEGNTYREKNRDKSIVQLSKVDYACLCIYIRWCCLIDDAILYVSHTPIAPTGKEGEYEGEVNCAGGYIS